MARLLNLDDFKAAEKVEMATATKTPQGAQHDAIDADTGKQKWLSPAQEDALFAEIYAKITHAA